MAARSAKLGKEGGICVKIPANYVEQLRKRAADADNIMCLGLDPVLQRIPVQGKNSEERIVKFYTAILNAMVDEDVLPAIAKPNAAFYEQYGLEGLRALKAIIDAYKKVGIPILIDAKRGDIGDTSAAYANAWFNWWGVDAITVAPYMGFDSVQPFIAHCENGKGAYLLVRTSNEGAKDFQDLRTNNEPLYWHVAKKLLAWHKPGLGAVIGATYPKELEQLSEFFVASGKAVPFLIPGVGKQGGSISEVVRILRKTNNELAIHRINASSAINYAYEKEKTDDFAGAAVKALRAMIK
ncbi:orotidine-5'-phosphate decarboxylase [Candidatus Woesearchaeota archaeon]|nr:orotidine-5'-phosphate decarboxylase [Candidatus Woesearchaeota archaeon]